MPSTTPHLLRTATVSLELHNVSKLYGGFAALRHVTLSLPAGASVVLLGPNGAGKSTLLRLLAGLASPTYGEVRVFGQPPLHQRGRVATMGHQPMLYDELTAAENLSYLLRLHRPGLSSAAVHQHVAAALKEVALDPANPRRFGEYSQGMRQRASLARVLLDEPEVLLLDEPFSNLDLASADLMVRRLQLYLAQPASTGLARTLLLITHQAELARPLARTTLTMANGMLQSETTVPSPPKPPAQAALPV